MLVNIPTEIFYFVLGIVVTFAIMYFVGYYYEKKELEELEHLDWDKFGEIADKYNHEEKHPSVPTYSEEEVQKIIRTALQEKEEK